MTDQEIQVWKSTIESVLLDNKEWDDKNKSERYHVLFKGIKMPPKVVLARAYSIIEEQHPELELKSVAGGVPTNQFLEDFGFKITEDLLYNNTDYKKLKNHIDKKIKNKALFQDFINFGYTFLSDLNIEVYKVRMALEAQGILSIIVGMRAAYSYVEKKGNSQIGFLVSTNFKVRNEGRYNFVYDYPYKGEPSQNFVKLEVTQWSDIDKELLHEHKQQFQLQYDEIKNSKRTQWNVEAKTTNNALKYILFKNLNLNKFMSDNTIENNEIDIVKLLRNQFKRIWRCADSYKWNILRDYDVLTFDWLDNNIDYRAIDIKSLKRGRRAIEPWVNRMKTGDLVFVMGKNQYNGIAIVNSEYKFQDNVIDLGSNGVKPSVKVEYIHKLDNPINHGLDSHNNPTTFASIDAYKFSLDKTIEMIKEKVPEAYTALLSFLNLSASQNERREKPAYNSGLDIELNQILFGPPGTGKTYKTISTALSIIVPEFYEANKNDREALVSKFRELTIANWSDTKGQIAFCTFHQSFTYEDFVEGIKPKVINEKDIIYEVQKGIFKALCDRARTATNDTSDFDTVINKLQNDILDNGIITLSTDRGNQFDVNYTGQTTFRIRPHESTAENPQYPASIENIRMLYEGAPLTDVYNPSYVKGILEHLYSHYNLSPFEEVVDNDKPYVIIIDEINRGNVASIFGELITLIEPDKRTGGTEELSVILPYSKKEFKVPNNVYIIGTMNTADRSVEALDSALRRRFSFKEVMPNYGVIASVLQEKNDWEGLKISIILEKINKRITRLIDRDHQIGHSYLLKLKNVPTSNFTNSLKGIFSKNIIPLLQEYFFNDFNKLGLVLGEAFLSKQDYEDNLFAVFQDGESSDYEDDAYDLIDPLAMTNDEFIEAIKKLIN